MSNIGMITVAQLYAGRVPEGYCSVKLKPKESGRYDTIDIVGSISPKVMESKHFYKGEHRGWVEGDWVKVMAWKE